MHQLQKALGEWGCELHAYVLMGNHVHLLVTSRESQAMPRMMHLLGTRFARWVNHRHGRTGYVFEGRYKSCLVGDAAYFLTVMAYIELNPVRAGMISKPAEYAWSSHVANASGSPAGLLTPHKIYLGLARDPPRRGRRYAQLFEKRITDVQLAAIRSATQQDRALGDETFLSSLAGKLRRPVAVESHGGPRTKGTKGTG